MKHCEYTKSLNSIRYPVRELYDIEKSRIDNLDFNIDEISVEHIVYALSRMIGVNSHLPFKAIEDVAGTDVAFKVAKHLATLRGQKGYAAFLKNKGVQTGTPAIMAEYEDKVHTIRGPVYAYARFAEFDDEKCVVTRKKCPYTEWTGEGTLQYVSAFCESMVRGYAQVDKAITRVELPRRLCVGDSICEMVWHYAKS